MLRERPDSEVEAVDDVLVVGAVSSAETSRRFYADILGLQPDEGYEAGAAAVGREFCFWGQHHRLILRLVDNPRIDTVKRKALICVKSLLRIREVLDELRIEYVRSRSLGWAGERVLVRDPSGNLLELRQERLL